MKQKDFKEHYKTNMDKKGAFIYNKTEVSVLEKPSLLVSTVKETLDAPQQKSIFLGTEQVEVILGTIKMDEIIHHQQTQMMTFTTGFQS